MALAGVDDGLGAKAIAESGAEQVPQRYVRSEETRLGPLNSAEEIPVINLECLFKSSSDQEQKKVVEQIAEACETYGFFQLINHGVPESTISHLLQAAHDFFNLTPEEKQKFGMSDKWKHVTDDPYGLFCYGVSFQTGASTAMDWRDWVSFQGTLAARYDAFPNNPAFFREAAQEYEAAVARVENLLLGLISRGLGLQQEFLRNALGTEPYTYMLLNCYPPCPAPSLVAGLSSHSDPLLLTVVSQEQVSGLEVLHKDKWIPVKPIQNALIVNLGDLMQIFTNGKYKSPTHRVRANSEKLRISMVRFFAPSKSSPVAPIEELLGPEKQPRYRACTCGEYVKHFYTLKLQGKSCLDYVTIKTS